MPILTPLPDTVPEVPEGTLLIEAVDDGNFLERANVAWLSAMTEAIKRVGKASVTMTVMIEPGKVDDEDEREQPFKISTKVRLNLPNVENKGVFVPDEDGVIRTDLRTIRHILRPLGDGRFSNQHGEETDEQGIVVAASRPLRAAGS